MDTRETIAQIGQSTLMSIGAREFVAGPNDLRFRVGRGDRKVIVTLDANDTYTVQTFMMRSGRTVYQVDGIYCEQLAEAVYQAHQEHLRNPPGGPVMGQAETRTPIKCRECNRPIVEHESLGWTHKKPTRVDREFSRIAHLASPASDKCPKCGMSPATSSGIGHAILCRGATRSTSGPAT